MQRLGQEQNLNRSWLLVESTNSAGNSIFLCRAGAEGDLEYWKNPDLGSIYNMISSGFRI